jgi:hypothetical protein
MSYRIFYDELYFFISMNSATKKRLKCMFCAVLLTYSATVSAINKSSVSIF